jgi:hypothetical protein
MTSLKRYSKKRKKDDSVEGYGFGWFSKSDVLTGYTLNVHSGSDK